ncbi:phage major capsid protein [Rhizobium deserti]|uniref:Phage major capsid protein n=1 Tax=Rhizobium deserti TaxID=2547961 RepID=A0A4V6PLZ2_9HYPH|nr:phage major capsid protein [Rhizobium deserti]TDK38600.1 phage major capsid protein [Rhizobium deserti]
MTKHFVLETRAEPEDDPLAGAVQAVEELRTGFTEFRTGAEQQLAGLAEIRTQLADLETRMNRPGNGGGNGTGEISLERRAFGNFLRSGREALDVEEVRALIVGDDVKGGYLAPAEFQAEVIRGIVEISPIRQAVRVGSTGAGSVVLPKLTGRPTASWVGEDEQRDETTMTFGQLEIPVHELACFIDVSTRLLEDSAINVESEIASELSQEFALKEGAAFSNGDGSKKPLGIQRANIKPVLNGHAANVNADKLIGLMYDLPQQYRNIGSWMMNGTTLGIIRTLKDANGNYLWQPSIQAGQPSTLLGRPVIEDPEMPNIGTAGAEPIIYGDFNRGYRIYDRVGMSIMRDPFTQATRGLVRFHARRRVGGGPVLTEALRKLKMAAA